MRNIKFIGVGVLIAFLILGFYFVIAGWTFEYLFSIRNRTVNR